MSGDLVGGAQSGPTVEVAAHKRVGDRWIGTTLANTYHITSLLGEGGMGAVYRARHTRLPAEFAVKVLTSDSLKEGEAIARFLREAEISVKLRHPHIVEVFDFNQTPSNDLYIVMELLEGETLYDRLARKKTLSLKETVAVTKQVASALAAAHRRGVIHRDLKPSNIFLVKHDHDDKWVKVVDFGISKLIGSSNTLTGEKRILGTPWYMSPEQVRGQTDKMDGRADVFALAAIVYEMLSGQQAFASESIATALYKVAHEAPPPLRDLSGAVPPAVELVLMRALAKDVASRTPEVEQFAKELEQAVQQSRTMAMAPLDGAAAAAAISAAGLPSVDAPAGAYADMTGPQLPDHVAVAPAAAPKTGRGVVPAGYDVVTDAMPARRRSIALPLAIVVFGVGMGALAATLLLRESKPKPSAAATKVTADQAAAIKSAVERATAAKAAADKATAAAKTAAAMAATDKAAADKAAADKAAADKAAAAAAAGGGAGSGSAAAAVASTKNGTARARSHARVRARLRAARRRARARARQRAATVAAAKATAKARASAAAAAKAAAKARASKAARASAQAKAAAKAAKTSTKKTPTKRKDWVKTADELFR